MLQWTELGEEATKDPAISWIMSSLFFLFLIISEGEGWKWNGVSSVSLRQVTFINCLLRWCAIDQSVRSWHFHCRSCDACPSHICPGCEDDALKITEGAQIPKVPGKSNWTQPCLFTFKRESDQHWERKRVHNEDALLLGWQLDKDD